VPAYADASDVTEIATNLGAASQWSGWPIAPDDVVCHLDRLAAAAPPTGSVIVHPSARFADLVVSADVSAQLSEARARLEHRAVVLDQWGFLTGRPGRRGLRILFHGPPGTGKTLAAEVLSTALGTDLLIVDLSQMVSKWIGETEKHLAGAFSFAEQTGAALFFDEADALFGRRTEVGDARDRYANLETSYLLSRIERYEGLVILATNLRQNLDGAFTRRLDFVVGFDPPDAAQREALWRRLLPLGAPLDPDVDLSQIAGRYAVTGGIIRGAAVAAAYLAAARRGHIRTDDIVHALEREYAKAGQHFPGPRHSTPEHP
jgi:SpoVK/Ycf46/Vps4 family AAA+-type ATPase